MHDSWLSAITVTMLTCSRGHCGVVSGDGKILQRAETALTEEHLLHSRQGWTWGAGQAFIQKWQQMNASHCVPPEGKKASGRVSSALQWLGYISGWQNKEVAIDRREYLEAIATKDKLGDECREFRSAICANVQDGHKIHLNVSGIECNELWSDKDLSLVTVTAGDQRT